MRIVCETGFYKFFPFHVADIRRFSTKYGIELVQCEDYFTFPILAALPKFSFIGQIYSGAIIGLANHAGKREEVLAANGLTYNVSLNRLVLASTLVFKKMDYAISNYIVMDKMPQAYNYDNTGLITGFSLIIDIQFMKYKIERFFYAEV